MSSRKPVAVVVGAGSGNGTALARRFAEAGYSVAALARSEKSLDAVAKEVEGVAGYACDVTDPASVAAAFAAIRRDLGEVDTLLYNAGSGAFLDIEATTPEQFEQSWRVNAFGGFLCAREVMSAMKAAGGGNIVFIGATASRRGGPRTAAFAAAKAAQRSLAELLARSLWPAGVHVALIIVDGIVGTPEALTVMPDKAAAFVKPAGVAETALQLCRQDRSAWSFEVEARPFAEKW